MKVYGKYKSIKAVDLNKVNGDLSQAFDVEKHIFVDESDIQANCYKSKIRDKKEIKELLVKEQQHNSNLQIYDSKKHRN